MDQFSHGGAIAFFLIISGVLTLVVGLVLLAFYRRAVRRWMGTTTAQDAMSMADGSRPTRATATPQAPLALDVVDPRTSVHKGVFESAAMRGARAGFHRAAVVYAIAGLAHAAVATAMQIAFGAFEFAPVRAAVVFWANAWPVVLMLWLFWGPTDEGSWGRSLFTQACWRQLR
ncbi:MAG: hypothetical protein HC826_02025 [Rhodospirillales bacterium]|nr:hypothetical protein [Rhodospirillales bacterium]